MSEPENVGPGVAPAEDSLARAAAAGPALFRDEEEDASLPGVVPEEPVVDTRDQGFFFGEATSAE